MVGKLKCNVLKKLFNIACWKDNCTKFFKRALIKVKPNKTYCEKKKKKNS